MYAIVPPRVSCCTGLLVLGKIEVEEERLAFGTDQDVGRLDVAVQDAPVVSVLQSIGKLSDHPGSGLEVAELAKSGNGSKTFRG